MNARTRIVIDPTLPQPSWAMEYTGPVFLREYRSGALLTLGMYPSAQAAKDACEIGDWVRLGNGWRSRDGRTIIEEPRT